MGLSKNILLTIKDYEVKLDKDIKFYEYDTINLCFSIMEYGIVVKDGVSVNKLMPIQALKAYMLIETPDKKDYAEATKIEDNKVVFNLGNRYSRFIGVGRMQIVIKDADGCRITLPEFPFEIKESINTGWDDTVDFLETEHGVIIADELGRPIEVTKISEFDETDEITPQTYTMVINEDGNKKMKLDTMMESISEMIDFGVEEIDERIDRIIEVYDDEEVEVEFPSLHNDVERIKDEVNEISESLDKLDTEYKEISNRLEERKITHTMKKNNTTSIPSDESLTDSLHVTLEYDAVSTNPKWYEGSAIHARTYVGKNGNGAVGTTHGISTQLKVDNCSDVRSEYTPLFVDMTTNSPCCPWGMDLNVHSTEQGADEIIVGQSVFVNRYNGGNILNKSYGTAIVTRPGKGGGDGLKDRINSTTYPLDYGLIIAGLSGDSAKLNPTNGFDVGLQIGGTAKTWMYDERSVIGKGIVIQDTRDTALTIEQGTNTNPKLIDFQPFNSSPTFGVNMENGGLVLRNRTNNNNVVAVDTNENVMFSNNSVQINSNGYITIQNSKEVGRPITQGNTEMIINIPQGNNLGTNNYACFVTPSWLTTFRVKTKTATNFTVEFGTPAPQYASIDWWICL